MLVRAVLFDLGNTLVAYYDGAEFPQVLRECLQQCAAVLGWSEAAARDDALFAQAMALHAESPDCAVRPLDRRLSELFGLDGSVDASTLPLLCEAFLKPIFERARLDPEALSVLQSLRERNIKVGIVSNSPWGSSANVWRQELARHGLLERVDAAVFCGDVGWRKPNPAPFNRALELLQVAPHDAIFVGDDVRWDLVGAQNAGIRPVLLRITIHRLSDVLDLMGSPMERDV
jgi:putative hydrolase of the HAD superfamily